MLPTIPVKYARTRTPAAGGAPSAWNVVTSTAEVEAPPGERAEQARVGAAGEADGVADRAAEEARRGG